MLRKLLICGLVAGFFAGLVAFGFMTVAGEPAVDQAIAYEEAHAPPVPPGEEEQEPVSRDTQKGVGLLTASTVYGLALGGIFALVFAYAYGRVGRASPARTALWLAAAAFLVVYLVPFIKYPPNPPAVGDPDTIGERTALYLVMVWISVLAALAAVRLRRTLAQRRAPEVATGLAGVAYLAVVVVAGLALPAIHEIPETFPATTLWRFREASVGTQLVMWTSIGAVFSVTAQRVMTGRPLWAFGGRRRAAATAGE
ncbi:MAG: CbtA family protein [Thermoleophilaceae bacterium]|nr:CbtA family protein [Thermoleophilaceae bacterium]